MFKVIRRIDQGSQGTVFRCFHLLTDKQVVIKISEHSKELGQEINCLKKLHAKIRKAYDDKKDLVTKIIDFGILILTNFSNEV